VVKERVELYLYSLCGPSWPVLGRTLPLVICVLPNCLVMRESQFHELCYVKLFEERNTYYVPTRRSRQSWTVGAGGGLRYSPSRKHEYAFVQYIQLSAFPADITVALIRGNETERHLHQ
jgi:hypothetical protein